MKIIKNDSIDLYRKRMIESDRMYLLGDEDVGKEDNLIDNQIVNEYMEGIKKLPVKYASVLDCLALQEKSVKETSDELGISENAVRKRYERARKMLIVKMGLKNNMEKKIGRKGRRNEGKTEY